VGRLEHDVLRDGRIAATGERSNTFAPAAAAARINPTLALYGSTCALPRVRMPAAAVKPSVRRRAAPSSHRPRTPASARNRCSVRSRRASVGVIA
jgi:hypothetical protein